MDKTGKVVAIKGQDSLMNSIMDMATEGDQEMRQALQKQLSQLLGEDFVRNTLSESFGVLPDSTVYVGDSWKRQMNPMASMPITMSSTYTFKELKDSVATIGISGTVQTSFDGKSLLGHLPT